MRKVQIQKKTAKDLRKEKEIKKARKVVERFSRDKDFRFLHDQISQVFGDHLVSDLKSFIARKVFPRDFYPEYDGVEDAHYAYRVRDRLRKEVLVPLRQALELPEIYMSAKKWNSLPYPRVASIAMSNYKKHFLKHDETRFNEFLSKVESGEEKIAAGALFPHDIIKRLNDGENDGGRVAELQWKRMVDDLSEKGKLQNCIAVCDVSGSMSGEPMEVCVALGLLLSELSEHPWNGQKVTGNLDKDKMIKKVFIFSDMEFDTARGGYGYYRQQAASGWDTDYEVIKRKFEERGYTVPQIVFWNLRDSKATPVTSNQKGVALVSGFSKNAMKLFLEDEDVPDPVSVMRFALSGPEYQQLAVID
ncbi:hypothetical protein IFM89_032213 [Coptis chinensis]|uniref:Uncharacterized protein n=1 Tax=Coptis chinensis TaxID=261450 RepID=A0A835HZ58_9MAGN|nr:hypothetical protein IFM89_032213 [Coptis chinensis]